MCVYVCVCGDGCGGWGTVLYLCDNSLSAVTVMVSFPPLATVGLNSVLLISNHIHKNCLAEGFQQYHSHIRRMRGW